MIATVKQVQNFGTSKGYHKNVFTKHCLLSLLFLVNFHIIQCFSQETTKSLPSWYDADQNVKVLISQYGYNPEHPKLVNYKGEADSFRVVRTVDQVSVFSGALHKVMGDFGSFWQGDFSTLLTEGDYYILIGNDRSPRSFSIRANLWDNLQKYIAWYYFGLRRMGEDNVMGNLGDYRLVNWEHGLIPLPDGNQYKYMGKAWADGVDGRTYPSASLVVAQYCALKETNPFWDRSDWIYEQVRWGLDGTLSYLEKDGRLRFMQAAWPDHQGKTYDNKFYSGDEKILGDAFDPEHTVNEYNGENPEVVHTSLLIGPAYATVLFRDKDPAFFDRVEILVKNGYQSILNQYDPFPKKYSLGSWIWLNYLMWRMTGESAYHQRAVEAADKLMALQHNVFAGDYSLSARGWFYKDSTSSRNPWGEKPEQEVMITPWIYQGLFKLIEDCPENPKAEAWKRSVGMYARDYLLAFSRQNAFGYTPMKVEADADSDLVRHRGEVSYQYFAKIGRQFHQIGNAAFMLKTGKLLQDQELIDAAWQQLFWFAGNNPMGTSHIYSFGQNINSTQGYQKNLGRAFPGGTVNGATGDEMDNPVHDHYNEYYTYANLNVLWLSTVIGARRFENPLELWPKELKEASHTSNPDAHPLSTFPLRLKGGFTYSFMATVRDDTAHDVLWLVNNIAGGNPNLGTITNDGKFTAPFVNSETKVTIEAISRKNKHVRDYTEATIYPVPKKVESLKYTLKNGKVYLAWSPVVENLTGYTVWKRLPKGDEGIGTVFEMVGATPAGQTSYIYPNDTIYYYEDHVNPIGTEYIVMGYNMKEDTGFRFNEDRQYRAGWLENHEDCPNKIYGFGPPSERVVIR